MSGRMVKTTEYIPRIFTTVEELSHDRSSYDSTMVRFAVESQDEADLKLNQESCHRFLVRIPEPHGGF